MLFLIGLIIAGFLFFLLCFKKEKHRADHILIAWIGVLTVHLFLHYLHFTGVIYQYPHALGITLPFPVLHGVFLYFYTLELTRQHTHTGFAIFITLIPFLLLLILAVPFYLLSAEEKIQVFLNEGQGYEWYSLVQQIVIVLSGFGYSLFSIRQIHKYREQIQNYLSNTDKVLLKWLEYLAVGLALIWCLVVFFDDDIIFTGVVFFVLYIGFAGINYAPVFTITAGESAFEQEKGTGARTMRYAKSGLKEVEAVHVFDRLQELVYVEKLYRNSELTLNDVAGKMDLHPNKLSQAINSTTGQSFYHYINTCRIKEFLEIAALPGNQQFTYLALAYECGFSSKSTFNKYFKIHTGTTPSGYFKK